jgi:hypothetical protein
MAARHPDPLLWEDLHVRVDRSAGPACGACIADRRPSAAAPNVHADAGVAASASWDLFFRALGA